MNADCQRPTRHRVRMLCQAVRERGFQLLGEVILDLSSNGMLLRCARPVLTGESVIVSFFEPIESRWYDTDAVVTRVIHGRRRGDEERCVGLEFRSLPIEDRARLAAALGRRHFVERAEQEFEGWDAASYDSPDDAYGVYALTM